MGEVGRIRDTKTKEGKVMSGLRGWGPNVNGVLSVGRK